MDEEDDFLPNWPEVEVSRGFRDAEISEADAMPLRLRFGNLPNHKLAALRDAACTEDNSIGVPYNQEEMDDPDINHDVNDPYVGADKIDGMHEAVFIEAPREANFFGRANFCKSAHKVGTFMDFAQGDYVCLYFPVEYLDLRSCRLGTFVQKQDSHSIALKALWETFMFISTPPFCTAGVLSDYGNAKPMNKTGSVFKIREFHDKDGIYMEHVVSAIEIVKSDTGQIAGYTTWFFSTHRSFSFHRAIQYFLEYVGNIALKIRPKRETDMPHDTKRQRATEMFLKRMHGEGIKIESHFDFLTYMSQYLNLCNVAFPGFDSMALGLREPLGADEGKKGYDADVILQTFSYKNAQCIMKERCSRSGMKLHADHLVHNYVDRIMRPLVPVADTFIRFPDPKSLFPLPLQTIPPENLVAFHWPHYRKIIRGEMPGDHEEEDEEEEHAECNLKPSQMALNVAYSEILSGSCHEVNNERVMAVEDRLRTWNLYKYRLGLKGRLQTYEEQKFALQRDTDRARQEGNRDEVENALKIQSEFSKNWDTEFDEIARTMLRMMGDTIGSTTGANKFYEHFQEALRNYHQLNKAGEHKNLIHFIPPTISTNHSPFNNMINWLMLQIENFTGCDVTHRYVIMCIILGMGCCDLNIPQERDCVYIESISGNGKTWVLNLLKNCVISFTDTVAGSKKSNTTGEIQTHSIELLPEVDERMSGIETGIADEAIKELTSSGAVTVKRCIPQKDLDGETKHVTVYQVTVMLQSYLMNGTHAFQKFATEYQTRYQRVVMQSAVENPLDPTHQIRRAHVEKDDVMMERFFTIMKDTQFWVGTWYTWAWLRNKRVEDTIGNEIFTHFLQALADSGYPTHVTSRKRSFIVRQMCALQMMNAVFQEFFGLDANIKNKMARKEPDITWVRRLDKHAVVPWEVALFTISMYCENICPISQSIIINRLLTAIKAPRPYDLHDFTVRDPNARDPQGNLLPNGLPNGYQMRKLSKDYDPHYQSFSEKSLDIAITELVSICGGWTETEVRNLIDPRRGRTKYGSFCHEDPETALRIPALMRNPDGSPIRKQIVDSDGKAKTVYDYQLRPPIIYDSKNGFSVLVDLHEDVVTKRVEEAFRKIAFTGLEYITYAPALGMPCKSADGMFFPSVWKTIVLPRNRRTFTSIRPFPITERSALAYSGMKVQTPYWKNTANYETGAIERHSFELDAFYNHWRQCFHSQTDLDGYDQSAAPEVAIEMQKAYFIRHPNYFVNHPSLPTSLGEVEEDGTVERVPDYARYSVDKIEHQIKQRRGQLVSVKMEKREAKRSIHDLADFDDDEDFTPLKFDKPKKE